MVQATGPTETGITLSKSTSKLIQFEVNFASDSLVLDETQTDAGVFTSVTLTDAASTDETGAPQLPVIGQMLAVPFGVELELQITAGKSHTQKISAPVLPVPDQVAEWSLPTEISPVAELLGIHLEYEPNPEYYESKSSYPGGLGKIATDGVIRQQRVVGIALYPLQYDPLTSELTIYESFAVTLTFQGQAQIEKSAAVPESQAYETYFSQMLLNYESSQAWRLEVSSQNEIQGSSSLLSGSTSSPWSPPDPGWRIKVREDGFYQLTYAALAAVGVDVDNLDPRTLRIYHLGEEIAIQVEGEADGSFDPADSFVFYGQALDDKYTLNNVYWLTYGAENGLRMLERQVSTPTAQLAQSYTAKPHLEQNVWYIPAVTGEDASERFLWAGIFAEEGQVTLPSQVFTHTFSLTAPSVANSQLTLDLFGQTTHTMGYKAVISLNGTQLGILEWAGPTWAHFSALIPIGTLLSGNNTLTISLDNSDQVPTPDHRYRDYVYLDQVDLTYTSGFQATSNKLTFTYDLTQETGFEIQGFSTNQLALFDLTNPEFPVLLTDFGIQSDGAGFRLSFQENNQISGEHRYSASALSAYKTVYAIEQVAPYDLRSSSNGADYLIITHTDLLTPAQTLADYRAGQDLRVQIVNVQDIYDQFGFGIEGRDPIHAFLAYAYAQWEAPAPTYVVLLGDGHYNPKGYNQAIYGALRKNLIPPYLAYADVKLGETAVDNRYAAIVGDDYLPDMMLGRMAVATAGQATAFINKIMAYEQLPANNNWGTPLLAVADNPDAGGNFPALSQALLVSSYPDNFAVERVYLGVTHSTISAARTDVIAAINDGRFLVNYIGHAASSQWAGYDGESTPGFNGTFLALSDVAGLTNQNKYPIISAMTCWEGYYINPNPVGSNQEALAEVITRAENKGAVASWSPTGTSVANGHDIINRGFFKAIFNSVVPTIGQATQQSLTDLWATGTHLDLADTFLLFGDPAMHFNRGLTGVPESYSTGFDTTLVVSAADGVLANDINPAGLPFTAVLVQSTESGQLSFASDGSFTYIPDLHYFGTDSFTYQLFDGTHYSNTTKVTIIVEAGWATYLPVVGK